jgi:hypothetical protein
VERVAKYCLAARLRLSLDPEELRRDIWTIGQPAASRLGGSKMAKDRALERALPHLGRGIGRKAEVERRDRFARDGGNCGF